MWTRLDQLLIKYLKDTMEQFWLMVKLVLEKHIQWLVLLTHHKPKELFQIHLHTYLDILPKLRRIKSKLFFFKFSNFPNKIFSLRFLVRVSYMEIYNEEVRDLLGKQTNKSLEVKERADIGVFVKDLSGYVVHNADDLENIMKLGNKNRVVGATKMNLESSRSHAIFSITVESSETDETGEQHVKMGKLQLVDLAGSERQSKTQASGIRLKEATKINLSLSVLGNVISALVDGKSTHIPYRNSKLTRLLQDSLGGNSKTVMVSWVLLILICLFNFCFFL